MFRDNNENTVCLQIPNFEACVYTIRHILVGLQTRSQESHLLTDLCLWRPPFCEMLQTMLFRNISGIGQPEWLDDDDEATKVAVNLATVGELLQLGVKSLPQNWIALHFHHHHCQHHHQCPHHHANIDSILEARSKNNVLFANFMISLLCRFLLRCESKFYIIALLRLARRLPFVSVA